MILPELVEVVRSGMVEGSHCGSVVARDGAGRVVLALGDQSGPVLPRSANKPLQAAGLLEEGWEPADDRELAIAAASHNGEPEHLQVVRRLLAGAGLSPDDLRCPPLLPLSVPAAHALLAAGDIASALTHNCSGKHAAMLATCVARGWPTSGYLEADHPLQRALTGWVAELAGEPVRHVAVDGCGAPQHSLTLPGLALAYRRLVTAPAGTPPRRVADAMRAHPNLVGGADRDVTTLMQAVPGLLAKDGAEGVYAAALPDGSAVALKIQDGAARARPPVLVAALRRLGVPDPAALDACATGPVLGGGAPVGQVRATPALTALSAPFALSAPSAVSALAPAALAAPSAVARPAGGDDDPRGWMSGGQVPDLQLPDVDGHRRTLSQLIGGDPTLLHFYRGAFCPKERQFFRLLTALQEEAEVAYTRFVSVSVDPPEVAAAFRAGIDARWTFLCDPARLYLDRLGLRETTDTVHHPYLPTCVVLSPDLTVHSAYQGYWFWGRPTAEELRQDFRAVSRAVRPDWDPPR